MTESAMLFSITFASSLASRLSVAARDVAELLRGDSAPANTLAKKQRDRLLPAAYKDDAEASAEFRRYVESELVDRKAGGAERIALTLQGSVTDPHSEELITVTLTHGEMLEWATVLTDIRLSLATQLGITDEESPQQYQFITDAAERDRWELYAWFGRLQEHVVDALDS